MREETLAFQTIPVTHQNRVEDRVSFLYLEHAKLLQTENGVEAWRTDLAGEGVRSKLQLPVATLALLSLGPGTSITQAASASCARSGCVVQFTNGGAFPELSSMVPLTTSAKWAIAQAKVVSDTTLSKRVAKQFYRKQFGDDSFEGSLSQMRGVEGSLMKRIYAREASRAKLRGWRRNTEGEDAVNVALNVGNSILYGISSCTVQALAMSQALGVIHRGNAKAFLFDLADLYKPMLTLPLAFSLAHESPEAVPSLVRGELRKKFAKMKLTRDLVTFLIQTFEPYTPEREDDRLFDGAREVEGNRNYASSRSDKLLEEEVLLEESTLAIEDPEGEGT